MHRGVTPPSPPKKGEKYPKNTPSWLHFFKKYRNFGPEAAPGPLQKNTFFGGHWYPPLPPLSPLFFAFFCQFIFTSHSIIIERHVNIISYFLTFLKFILKSFFYYKIKIWCLWGDFFLFLIFSFFLKNSGLQIFKYLVRMSRGGAQPYPLGMGGDRGVVW